MEELKVKANEILEQTANCQDKYLSERRLLFFLLEHIKDNTELLEDMIVTFDKIIKLDKEYQNYVELKSNIGKLAKQEIRKTDNKNNHINLFEIQDKNEQTYTFFTRENAKEFIENNKSKFKNVEINIIENTNMDLESIVNRIV